MTSSRVMASILFALNLALIDPAFALQVADGQYSGSYNGIDFDAVQMSFNGVRARGGGGGAPLGGVIVWTQAGNPEDWENWHDCDGGDISGSQLCAEKGVCAAPNFTGRFLRQQGGNGGAVNTQQWDAIRNIYGCIGGTMFNNAYGSRYPDGAFYLGGGIGGGDGRPEFDHWQTAYFDAARIVPVANENRPLSYTVRYLIRINE